MHDMSGNLGVYIYISDDMEAVMEGFSRKSLRSGMVKDREADGLSSAAVTSRSGTGGIRRLGTPPVGSIEPAETFLQPNAFCALIRHHPLLRSLLSL